MTTDIFQLTFTHGQLAWVVAGGHFLAPPRWRRVMAHLRYLRQLGIPFCEARRGTGRGHRIRYSLDELMEVAVGLYALRQDVRPQVMASILRRHRTRLRRVYREALAERPAPALAPPALQTGDPLVALPDDTRVLWVATRSSATPDHYELVVPDQATDHATDVQEIDEMPEEIVEVAAIVDGPTEIRIPLTSVVWAVAYWAERVPEINPGRKSRESSTPSSPVHP